MTDLGYFDAILLGLIQGVTEFLPVSSSGHLAITQHFLDLGAESPTMLLFNVLAHVGTLVAVLWVFRSQAVRLGHRLWLESTSKTRDKAMCRIVVFALTATVVTAAIGLPFQDRFEASFGNLRGVGVFLMITGVMLAGTRLAPRGKVGWRKFKVPHALVIGVAQACAILPGISRSGATICAATYLGHRRRWAAEFSFLIAIPAILGGTLKKVIDTFSLSADEVSAMPWGAMGVGSVVSLMVGVVALKMLLKAVNRGRLHYFAGYCLLVGAVVFLVG